MVEQSLGKGTKIMQPYKEIANFESVLIDFDLGTKFSQ